MPFIFKLIAHIAKTKSLLKTNTLLAQILIEEICMVCLQSGQLRAHPLILSKDPGGVNCLAMVLCHSVSRILVELEEYKYFGEIISHCFDSNICVNYKQNI